MKTTTLVLAITLLALASHVYGEKMYGLCYTPFRAFGVCPTDDEVESDVQIMLRHTTRIRIYSTECVNVNKILLKYASKGSLSVLMGVYVDNRATDQQEVDYLIEALKEYPNADLAGIVVGNEVMYRNSLPKSTLIQRINEVREKVRGLGYHTGSQTLLNTPVYAVEIFPDKEINDASDALGLNIHPFYRPDLVDVSDSEEMSEKILQAAIEQIDLYRNMMPTKPIVVTEIGWPTQSDHTEMHRGDLAIALKFMDKFTEYCQANGILYYWFEAFDSSWKKSMFPNNGQSMSEFNFGLYQADRQTKKTLPGGCSSGCGTPSAPVPIPVTYYTPEPQFQAHSTEPKSYSPKIVHSEPYGSPYDSSYSGYHAEAKAVAQVQDGGYSFSQSNAFAYSNPYRRLLEDIWGL